jgi:potassium/hydrogen antiporter
LTDTEFALVLVVIGALLTAAFITNNVSRKFGLPSLLLYLMLGFFFGNGGKGDFLFDQPELVERCAELALGLILFKGGYEFRHSLWSRPKVLAEGVTLALLGTLFTALLTATAAHFMLSWPWLESLLLGAVLSSTDAAAVFSVFQSSELQTTHDTMEVLELESSTNDPLAYGLVVGLIAALMHPPLHLNHLVSGVMSGLGLGLLVGGGVGLLMVFTTMVVKRSSGREDLMMLAVLTSALGLAQLTGANPLITAFTAGVVLSSQREVKGEFWGPFVALSEVVLFLLLGLQVFPKVLWSHLPEALLITLVLMFFSRPIAVLAISPFFVPDLKRSLFISWAGLRGASPIVFGLLPKIEGAPKSQEIFATVFAVVLVSVLIQGTTLGLAARKLGLVAEPS